MGNEANEAACSGRYSKDSGEQNPPPAQFNPYKIHESLPLCSGCRLQWIRKIASSREANAPTASLMFANFSLSRTRGICLLATGAKGLRASADPEQSLLRLAAGARVQRHTRTAPREP